MFGRRLQPTLGAEVKTMIAVAGAIILLPVALIGLVYGFVRWGLAASRALLGDAFGHAAHRPAHH